MKPFYYFITSSIFIFLKLFYWLKVVGKENIPPGPCILAPNHSSYFDPPIVGSSSPAELHYLARASLFRFPIFGSFIRKVNSHPVDTDGEDIQALRTVLSLLKEGKKVLIFPEGKRSMDGDFLPFKLGVAMLSLHANVPIVPVVIEGAHEVWGKGRKFPRLGGRLKVTYLPAIYPEEFRSLSKKEAQKGITDTLFAKMSAVKNRPLS